MRPQVRLVLRIRTAQKATALSYTQIQLLSFDIMHVPETYMISRNDRASTMVEARARITFRIP